MVGINSQISKEIRIKISEKFDFDYFLKMRTQKIKLVQTIFQEKLPIMISHVGLINCNEVIKSQSERYRMKANTLIRN
jgi:hypothetical protein